MEAFHDFLHRKMTEAWQKMRQEGEVEGFLTQKALALRWGISRPYLSEVLSGTKAPSQDFILRAAFGLAAVLGPDAYWEVMLHPGSGVGFSRDLAGALLQFSRLPSDSQEEVLAKARSMAHENGRQNYAVA